MSETDLVGSDKRELSLLQPEAVEFTGIGVYRYTFDGTVLFMDRGALKIHELEELYPDPSAVVGKNLDELRTYVVPKGLVRWQARLHGKVQGIEYPFKTIKGTKKCVLLDAYLLRDPHTNQEAIQCIVRDITEHKRVTQALHESEEKFAKAFLASPDCISLRRLSDGKCIDVNDAWVRKLGIPRVEALGKTAKELGIVERAEDEDALLRLAKRKKEVDGHEVTLRGRQGQIIHGLSSTRIVEVDGEQCVLTVTRDLTDRRRMEQALGISEQRYRIVTEQAGQLAYDHDIALGQIKWSGAITAVTGYAPEELQHVTIEGWRELLHPEDRDEAVRLREEAQQRGAPYHAEYRLRHKDGSYLHMEDNGVLLKNEQEQVVRMLGVMKDVTGRRQAEEALKVSEIRYRRLFESAKDGILILDADTGQITDVNPFLIDMLGYSHEEFLGKKLWEIGLLGNTVACQASFAELQSQGCFRYEHLPLETADGRHIDVEFVSNIYQVDQQKVIQCNIRDITERKRAEEALRKSEERFRQIAENAGEWIWEVDANGVYTYASPAVEEILGFTPEEIVGKKHFYDFFLPEEREELKKAALAAFAGKNSFDEFINRNRHKSGATIWLSTSGVPILDAEGNLLGYRGADTDITERKGSDEALRESRQMLATVLDAIPIRVFWKDRNSVYLGCNQVFAADAGLKSPEEIVGKNDFELSWREQAELYRSDDHQVMATGMAKINYEEPQTWPDGTRLWLRTSKIPLRNSVDEIVGVLGCYEDITP